MIKLMGLVGLIGLMGCSSKESNVPEEKQEEIPIGFGAFVLKEGSTRAAGDGELTNALLQEKGFGVYCWYTGGTDVAFLDSKGTTPSSHISSYTQYVLMRNQKVEYDDETSTWGYTPSKYWPINPIEKLTFRAYAPYTNYLMLDATTGLPLLPVVVKGDDYGNGTQHDPLWGTGKHDGASDGDDAVTENERYGKLYNNYNYTMSGSLLASDNRDGTIDWYFHHGMAKLIFWGLLDDKGTDDNVTIKSITLTPLYDQGLLNIGSPAAVDTDKPDWEDTAGDIDVTIEGTDLANSTIGKYNEELLPNKGWTQLTPDNKGLLIIPRDFSLSPMTLTVTFEKSGSKEVTMSTEISQNFQGNTVYTLKMTISNALYVEINTVQSAFSPWVEVDADHAVYNW